MLKRILYTLLSVLLLSLPWLGGSALTLFVAFVPLLWVEHSLAGQTGGGKASPILALRRLGLRAVVAGDGLVGGLCGP